MSNDPAGVTRYKFPDENHSQGPQSGDGQLRSGGALPFLLAAAVPADKELVIFSGHTPPVIDHNAPPDSVQAFGDTYTQTVGAFRELGASLASLGLNFSNLIQIRALLVGDPAYGGRMDAEGFSRAYAAFFGTSENPYLVARTRLQVVGLVNPGWLVELEAIAVR
jgi:enamine deaminase RidA (YjgF/YER057c/UK114 family)